MIIGPHSLSTVVCLLSEFEGIVRREKSFLLKRFFLKSAFNSMDKLVLVLIAILTVVLVCVDSEVPGSGSGLVSGSGLGEFASTNGTNGTKDEENQTVQYCLSVFSKLSGLGGRRQSEHGDESIRAARRSFLHDLGIIARFVGFTEVESAGPGIENNETDWSEKPALGLLLLKDWTTTVSFTLQVVEEVRACLCVLCSGLTNTTKEEDSCYTEIWSSGNNKTNYSHTFNGFSFLGNRSQPSPSCEGPSPGSSYKVQHFFTTSSQNMSPLPVKTPVGLSSQNHGITQSCRKKLRATLKSHPDMLQCHNGRKLSSVNTHDSFQTNHSALAFYSSVLSSAMEILEFFSAADNLGVLQKLFKDDFTLESLKSPDFEKDVAFNVKTLLKTATIVFEEGYKSDHRCTTKLCLEISWLVQVARSLLSGQQATHRLLADLRFYACLVCRIDDESLPECRDDNNTFSCETSQPTWSPCLRSPICPSPYFTPTNNSKTGQEALSPKTRMTSLLVSALGVQQFPLRQEFCRQSCTPIPGDFSWKTVDSIEIIFTLMIVLVAGHLLASSEENFHLMKREPYCGLLYLNLFGVLKHILTITQYLVPKNRLWCWQDTFLIAGRKEATPLCAVTAVLNDGAAYSEWILYVLFIKVLLLFGEELLKKLEDSDQDNDEDDCLLKIMMGYVHVVSLFAGSSLLALGIYSIYSVITSHKQAFFLEGDPYRKACTIHPMSSSLLGPGSSFTYCFVVIVLTTLFGGQLKKIEAGRSSSSPDTGTNQEEPEKPKLSITAENLFDLRRIFWMLLFVHFFTVTLITILKAIDIERKLKTDIDQYLECHTTLSCNKSCSLSVWYWYVTLAKLPLRLSKFIAVLLPYYWIFFKEIRWPFWTVWKATVVARARVSPAAVDSSMEMTEMQRCDQIKASSGCDQNRQRISPPGPL